VINYLVEISAKTLAGVATTIRMCGHWASSAGVVVNGLEWKPCLTGLPAQSITIAGDGELSGTSIDWGEISWTHDIVNWSNIVFNGATAKIWRGNDGDAFAAYTQIFAGKIGAFNVSQLVATAALIGPEADLDRELLTLSYAGTGGAEGGSDLAGMLKPWVSGSAVNITPVLIDPLNMVYQVHGYGAIGDIVAVYESGFPVAASPTASVTNYVNLLATGLAPGQWSECLPTGMLRLGGAPKGTITVDVIGAVNGGSSPTTIGGILAHLISRVAPSAIVDASLSGLSQSWSFVANSSTTVGDVVRDALGQVGGYLVPTTSGSFSAGRFFSSSVVTGTLNADRTTAPLVRDANQKMAQSPAYKIRIGSNRNWTVMSENQISDAVKQAGDAANAAQNTANTANTTANSAYSTANTALTNTTTLSNRIDNVNGDIANLQTTYGSTATAAASAAAADAAKTAAQSANANAQTALTNANLASTSSINAALSSLLAGAVLFPAEMAPGRPFASSYLNPPATRAANIIPSSRYTTVSGVGSVWTNAASPTTFWDVGPVEAVAAVPGQTYEVEAKVRLTVADTNGAINCSSQVQIVGITSDYLTNSNPQVFSSSAPTGSISTLNSGSVYDWTIFKARYTVPATGAPTFLRPRVLGNYNNGTGNVPNATYQVAYLKFSNVSDVLAANTSMQSAGTSASGAATSASAASSSATQAKVTASSMFPERLDSTASTFTQSGLGSPESIAIVPPANIENLAGVGYVWTPTNATATSPALASRGVLPAIAGKVYETEVEYELIALNGGTATAITYLSSLTSDYQYTSASPNRGSFLGAMPTEGLYAWKYRWSSADASNVIGWRDPSLAVWLRVSARLTLTQGPTLWPTYRIRRFTIRDVTSVAQAEASAAAALTSKNAADASMTAAGSSATTASTQAGIATTKANDASGYAGQASGYATQANTSATNAAGSANTATTQAGLASNSAGAAAGSATAAQNSATTASTKATDAGTAASTATTQAGIASTKAGDASTFAGNASNSATQANTSATNALGSANTASTQATIASTASTAAKLATAVALPSAFTASQSVYWTQDETLTPESSTPYDSSWFNNGDPTYPVFVTRANQTRILSTIGSFVPVIGRTYRVSVQIVRATNAGGVSWGYVAFTTMAGGVASYKGQAGTDLNTIPTSGWTTLTAQWNCDGTYSQCKPRLHWNWDNNNGSATSANIYHIRSMLVEDVTGAVAAAGSASAAATSASTASTKAGDAGTSASQASSYAGQASTYANNASTFAGNASTFANNASNSAAAAQASFVLTSKVGLGTLNQNPTFADWPNGSGTIPAGWGDWENGTSNGRDAGINGNPYSLYFNAPADRNTGLFQNLQAGFGRYVLEILTDSDVTQGAGSLVYALDSSGSVLGSWTINFASDPDNSGWSGGASGGWYRRVFSKYIEAPINGTISNWNIYLMANWSGFGTQSAKQIHFHSARLRPATDAEIAGKRALSDAGTALAQISSLSQTVSDNKTAIATRVDTVEARLPASGNLIANSSFVNTAGWNQAIFGSNMSGSVDLAGNDWHPVSEHNIGVFQTGGNSGENSYWFTDVISVQPGQWYQISSYAASHRCDVGVAVEYWNADATAVTGNAFPIRISRGAAQNGGRDLNNWDRPFFNFQAPTSTLKVLLIRWGTNAGYSDSYSWWTRPQIIQVGGANAPLMPYQPSNNSAVVNIATGAIASLQGKTSAWWEVQTIAGNGRAQLKVHADGNGGGGVDIVGDLSVSGDVIIGGTVSTAKLANESVTIIRALSNTTEYVGSGSGTPNPGGGGGGGGGGGFGNPLP
jgi:hypothetical protein